MLTLINPVTRAEPFDHADWVFEANTMDSGPQPTPFVALISRNGNRMKRFEQVLDPLPQGHVFDGELDDDQSHHLSLFTCFAKPLATKGTNNVDASHNRIDDCCALGWAWLRKMWWRTTMSTLDFKTKADRDVAANTLAAPGAKWGGTSAGPGFGSYKIIAKCAAR